MSFKTYRAIDLCIMMTIMIVGELLVSYASNAWFKLNSLGVSIVFPILLIVAMRWGWLVAIPAVVGGVISCFFSQISGGSMVVNVQNITVSEIGYLSILFSLLWFKLISKKKTRENWLLSVAFVFALYIMYGIFKGIAYGIVYKQNIFNCMLNFLTRESITLLFATVVILITRKLDGVFEDQKTYLLRLEEQREKEEKKQKIRNS